ncbi:8-oxoguanine DNA glycosylase OGG fold protein [Brevibacterium senegalense]|uniref:8-oxoguanine DNA glycosylase OGG fold protein n=1 Tax=Brevibacterium senegalense TaxID=1033736 RepID=UPI0002D3A666|nr:hypothetical protein [Brevibacterium senegalense]
MSTHTHTTHTHSTHASWTTDSTGSQGDGGFPAPPAPLAALLSQSLIPQQKFKVPKETWLRRLGDIPEAADALETLPGWINRDDAVEAVRTQWPDSVTAAFVSAMVWAYGPRAGYAPYRVLRVLTASKAPAGKILNGRVVSALERSVETALTDGAVEGFSYLNDCTHKVRSHQREHADMLVGVDCGRIYGLGPSFFTKWLHVATLAFHPDDRALPRKTTRRPTAFAPTHPPAPQWDNQAVAWLGDVARTVDQTIFDQMKRPDLTGTDADSPHGFWSGGEAAHRSQSSSAFRDSTGWSPTTPEGDLLRLRVARTDHYARYVDLLTQWGEPHGVNASQVADRIYRLIRKDGESRSRVA